MEHNNLYMKILMPLFFGCLLCQNVLAADAPTSAKQQDSQQKMTQLQQLLAKAAQSSVAPATSAVPNQDGSLVLPAQAADNLGGVSTVISNVAPSVNGADTTDNAKPAKRDLYDEAFSGVVNQMLPMSPDQISKLRQVFTESQLAAATPPGVPPRPTSTSLQINLSPQATPPVIRLCAGYITSLVFVDTTGQPWPIAAYSIGDPSSFNIQWDRKGNTLLVQSATFYKRSNLAVMLRDLNTPVMITLISGQEAVDYRVDLRVPGFGPNAVYMQNGLPDSANPVLLDVLNGIPPAGSKELKVSGGNCQAWLLNNKLYLRTNLNVISPGWQSIMSSIDGTHAYQLQPAPVILALQNGRDKILRLTLEGLQ